MLHGQCTCLQIILPRYSRIQLWNIGFYYKQIIGQFFLVKTWGDIIIFWNILFCFFFFKPHEHLMAFWVHLGVRSIFMWKSSFKWVRLLVCMVSPSYIQMTFYLLAGSSQPAWQSSLFRITFGDNFQLSQLMNTPKYQRCGH